MKKYIYLFAILGLTFVACNPLEDVYTELDAQKEVISGDAVFTLSDEDYAALGLDFGNFSSLDDAKTMLPDYIKEKYPVWGQGSSALVGFDLYVGTTAGVSDFTGAEIYSLTNADYASAGSDAFGFYPNANPADHISDILAANITDASEGQMVLAKYKQYFENPVIGLANIYEANFNGGLDDWTATSVVGDQVWAASSFGGVEYAKMSGYSGAALANEDWLVSPEIDLSGETNLNFQINQAINYATNLNLLSILVSTDYSGDVTTATWDPIALTTAPDGTNFNFVLSENYDFSAYEGQVVNIAFKYESTDMEAATWEVDQMLVKALGISGATNSKGDYYMYSGGTWEPITGVYYLSSADFDSMGTGSGQPGQYNNFSSSISPDAYLPNFLKATYPYAQEEDELFVIYDYYSSTSGAQIRGNLFKFLDGMWVGNQSVVSTELQFGFDNGVWVPDNTIKYALVASDYSLIGDALAGTYPTQAGSAGNYGNFDRREGNAAYWSDAMLVEGFNILLDSIAPGAAEGQKYVITYAIYNGAAGFENISLIKTGGVWVLN